jgi:hypothetical protein
MVIHVDRAPVMTLWAAVAGLNAHAKGVRLGIHAPDPDKLNRR